MGATALNESVNVSAGRFYYHLDFLGDLVTRDKDRRYILSERGKLAYQMLTGNNFTEGNPTKKNSVESTVLSVLAPKLLLNHVFSTKSIGLPIAGAILILTLLVQSSALLVPSLLSLAHIPGTSAIWVSARYVANFAALFVFCAIASYALGKKGGDVDLFISLAISQAPLALFSIIWMAVPQYFGDNLASSPIFILFQIWSMGILTMTLSKAKRMSYMTSAAIVLCLGYITAILT
jgi:hypothetical protein